MNDAKKLLLAQLVLASFAGCGAKPMSDADLVRAASDRGGTIRIVAVDVKRQTAVIEREVKGLGALHGGRFLEEFRFRNGSWECQGSVTH